MNLLHDEITEMIIKSFYKVYNKLGYGFLEQVYENAMIIELKKMGLQTVQQSSIEVYYEGNVIGQYKTDIIVENKVIVELKAVKRTAKKHEAQLLNYLKATNIEVGLLMNFGTKPKFKRRIFENQKKKYNNTQNQKN